MFSHNGTVCMMHFSKNDDVVCLYKENLFYKSWFLSPQKTVFTKISFRLKMLFTNYLIFLHKKFTRLYFKYRKENCLIIEKWKMSENTFIMCHAFFILFVTDYEGYYL